MSLRHKLLTFSLGFILCLSIVIGFANRGSAACAGFPTDKGTVTSSVTTATSGTYYIWSRNRSTASGSNGYYLQIDNSTSNCFTVGDTNIPTNTWTWVNYQNGSTSSRMSVSLSSGSHTFKLYGLDANLQVDKVLFTTDSVCSPSGTGDNCANSTTDPPPIVISNPNNPSTTPSYNGTITVGSGNNKTIVKVDGQPLASGTGQVTLDTTQLSDGYHTLAIESIDANGNKTITYRKILVQNHHNPISRFYHSLYLGLGKNSLLAIIVMGLICLVLIFFFGLGLYLAWFFKVWEKIPYVNRIHLKFLHVPGFIHSVGAKLPKLRFPFMKMPPYNANASSVVVGSGSQATHTGTMQGNIFQRFFGHPGSRWFVVLGFALVGTVTALYSLAATTAFTVEPENGSIATASRVNDGTASGGSYILFGNGQCPSGQTGTPPNCTTPPPATCPAGQVGTPPNCTTPQASGTVPCALTKAAKACWVANTGLLGGVTEAQVLAGGTSYTKYIGHVDIYGNRATLTSWSGAVSTISNTGRVEHAWIEGCVAMHSSDAELVDSLVRVNYSPPNGGQPFCYNEIGGGYNPVNTGAGGSETSTHLPGSTKHGTIDGTHGLALIKNVIIDANNMPIDSPYLRGQPCIGASDFLADHVQCTGAHKGFYMAVNAKLTESIVTGYSNQQQYSGCTVGDCYNHLEDIFMDTSKYIQVVHNWLGENKPHATGAINNGNSWKGSPYGWQVISDNFIVGGDGTGITFGAALSYSTIARNVFDESCGYQSNSGGRCYYGGDGGPWFAAAPNGSAAQGPSAGHNIWGTGADANKYAPTGASLPIPTF